ncbi:MAG: MBL fold metallo-hydrolase [Alphaproteobacteria bacterium]|nr:MBL fold metallo-hydrolase [Alphaproteobacteria bacterium]
MPLHLSFHGAAGTVTGSCYLLDTGRARVLVDCGLFQGPKTIKELNYRPFPFAPDSIDALLLTHAHTDHTGLIPKLVKGGFRGRIHCSEATRDLCAVMLPDSAEIQEFEVAQLNRRNETRGRPPVQPIYTRRDADAALKQFETHPFDEWRQGPDGIRFRFWNAGHLLGSASIEVEAIEASGRHTRLLFSGDIGPGDKLFMEDPEAPDRPDWIVCESTYGDRDRTDLKPDERRAALRKEVQAALKSGGNLLIPAFAIERTQELLYDLARLMQDKALPRAPVVIDSPLATEATETFQRHLCDMPEQPVDCSLIDMPNIRFTRSAEDSKALNKVVSGMIIISASGMAEAGRIRHHLLHNLWKPQATVLFVGYQAPGTLGRLLVDGESLVRIMGQEVAVRARIRTLDVYSGHADRGDLLAWVKARMPVKRAVFLTHGEDGARAALRDGITGLGLRPDRLVLPALDTTYLLPDTGPAQLRAATARLPVDAVTPTDWHNDRSALLLDLNRRLDALPDDAARRALLRRLRATLAA